MMPCVKPVLCAFLLVVLLGLGCSSGKSTPGEGSQREQQLQEVATMLRLYSGSRPRGPSKPADLAAHEVVSSTAYQAIRSGEIVIVWGAKMAGEGETTGTDAVIAYEKKVPTEGGLVLLHNGTVKEMSADAFKEAPKAK